MKTPKTPKTPEQLEREIAYYTWRLQRTLSRDRRERAQAALRVRERQLAEARRVRKDSAA